MVKAGFYTGDLGEVVVSPICPKIDQYPNLHHLPPSPFSFFLFIYFLFFYQGYPSIWDFSPKILEKKEKKYNNFFENM